MDWLILIPVTAAAIWLYVWFRPPSGSEWPEYGETEIGAAPSARKEDALAAVTVYSADQEQETALIRS